MLLSAATEIPIGKLLEVPLLPSDGNAETNTPAEVNLSILPVEAWLLRFPLEVALFTSATNTFPALSNARPSI